VIVGGLRDQLVARGRCSAAHKTPPNPATTRAIEAATPSHSGAGARHAAGLGQQKRLRAVVTVVTRGAQHRRSFTEHLDALCGLHIRRDQGLDLLRSYRIELAVDIGDEHGI